MISLSDFLAFDFTDDIKFVYPIKSPEKIKIQSISILEPPVEQFVRKDEIVISTALSVRDNSRLLYNFIYDIYASNAAALILAFPNDSYNQLDDIKEQFQNLNFPILTLPWSHLFSDLVDNTIKQLLNEEKKFATHLDSLQKELLTLYLSSKTLDDAAKMIKKYLDCDIWIIDVNEKVKGSNLKLLSSERDISTEFLNDDCYKIEIASGDKLYGYIFFRNYPTHDSEDLQTIKQSIITPLALWFDKEWSLLDSNKKAKRDFVWKISQGSFSTSQEIYSKAEILEINTDCSYICFVGYIVPKAEIEKGRWKIDAENTFIIQSVKNVIREQLINAAHSLDLSVMATLHKNTLIVYLEKPMADMEFKTANTYLDSLDNFLKQSLPNIALIWGFDNQEMPLDKLSQSFHNAKTALDIAIQSTSHTLRNCYQFSIRQKILLTLCNDSETLEMAKNTINNLIQYDEAKHSELVKTLHCYFQANYNISETARIMHLHRQSLIYRLNKIEKLCKLSLKNHEDLFILEICMTLSKQFNEMKTQYSKN